MFHITSPVSILKLNAINMFTVRNFKSENGSPRYFSLPVIFSTSDLSMFFQFRDIGSRPYLLLCVFPIKQKKFILKKLKKALICRSRICKTLLLFSNEREEKRSGPRPILGKSIHKKAKFAMCGSETLKNQLKN